MFSTLDEIRHLWQLKRVIFLHRYQILAFPLSRTYFTFSLIVETTTKKLLQFTMPTKSICNKNFGFIEQKYTTQKQEKSTDCHYFWSVYLFRVASYRLKFILHKDVVLHYFMCNIVGPACPPIILVKWWVFLTA